MISEDIEAFKREMKTPKQKVELVDLYHRRMEEFNN
jgi:hypothetical protein